MKIEKLIADELQCMFLNDSLIGFKEEYINNISRKLRTGEVKIVELVKKDSDLKVKILEALVRISKQKGYYP
jgi:hypothetical protein